MIDLFHQVAAADARGGSAHARNLEDRFLPMIPKEDRGLFRELRARNEGNTKIGFEQSGSGIIPARDVELAQSRTTKPLPEKSSELRSRIDPTKPGWKGKYLDFVEQYYRSLADAGQKHGLTLAPRFLKRYLDGTGGVVNLSRDEVRSHGALADAERRNRRRLEQSFFTRHLNEKGALREKRYPENLLRLRQLKDGQSIALGKTEMDGNVRTPWTILSGDVDTALAVGNSGIKSIGEFEARRDGNVIRVRGTVYHSMNDKYDFHKWQSGADGALALKKGGRAKEFEIRAEWKQFVSGTIEISPDGRLVNTHFKWTDMD